MTKFPRDDQFFMSKKCTTSRTALSAVFGLLVAIFAPPFIFWIEDGLGSHSLVCSQVFSSYRFMDGAYGALFTVVLGLGLIIGLVLRTTQFGRYLAFSCISALLCFMVLVKYLAPTYLQELNSCRGYWSDS